MIVGLIPSLTQAFDIRDEHGRTPLMNFIIRQEANISSIKKDITRLYDICYCEEKVCDGTDVKVVNNPQTGYSSTSVTPKYRNETRRRPSCTDADVHAHKQRKQDLANTITQTVNTMRFMAQSEDLHVDAIDYAGYAAQNYCYTYEIYAELRRQGAEFQLRTFAYFNPLTTAGVALGAWISIGGIKFLLGHHRYSR